MAVLHLYLYIWIVLMEARDFWIDVKNIYVTSNHAFISNVVGYYYTLLSFVVEITYAKKKKRF